jgi:hypothetical protein
MAIFSDAAGFKYMGDCQWGTLNITYPTQSFLQAHPHSSVSAELTSLCSTAGLSYRLVAAQSLFDNLTPCNILAFGANGDIDDRYVIGLNTWTGVGSFPVVGVIVYNNSGSIETSSTSVGSVTNRLYFLTTSASVNDGSFGARANFAVSSDTISPIQWVGSSDGNYLALVGFQRNFGGNSAVLSFFYAGKFADINTGFGYYNASNITNGIAMVGAGRSAVANPVYGSHYIASAGKQILQTGDAIYTIACSDSQTPTSQWATDFYAFDNNVTLGYPAIGRVRGMLLGTGTYTLGKPVKIIGSVFPDSGSPWYLPVGTFAGKTLLMRCYSSMT